MHYPREDFRKPKLIGIHQDIQNLKFAPPFPPPKTNNNKQTNKQNKNTLNFSTLSRFGNPYEALFLSSITI